MTLKVGMTVQFTTPKGEVRKGKLISIGKKRATVMVGKTKTLPPLDIVKEVKQKEMEKPSLKDILLDLDIDVSKKIAEAVEKDKKIDFYEITGDGGGWQDEMRDMRKSFKPDGKKDIFGRVPKWIDGVTNGNAGTTGTLTRAKARQIKNKYKKLTIKRFVETKKAPYFKLEDV